MYLTQTMTNDYVRMCVTATEIQTVWNTTPQHRGQVYVATDLPIYFPVCITVNCNTTNDKMLKHRYSTFWMPTQEEIQIILSETYQISPLEVMFNFIQFFKNNTDKFKSLHEYWLAYLMLSIHNKTWNGSEWI